MKNPRAFKDRRRSISVVKMAGTNPNGRYGISAQLRNNQAIQSKVSRFASAAERMDHRLTEWDEEFIRQMIHTVEVISADRIRVVLTDGIVIMQEVHNQ